MPFKIDLPLESPKDRYSTDACIVWCYDNRFRGLFHELCKSRNFQSTDPIFIAGGAKTFISPDRYSDRDFVLGQIERSIRLHSAPRVIIMTHEDCGAYGGSESFHDLDAEKRRHESDLKRAQEIVERRFGDSIVVESFFAGFDGLHKLA